MSDWTQIKPEAGVLVELTREYQRGHWRVMRPCKNIPGQDGASFDVDHCYLPDAVPPDAKPLLPACTMDEAWDALKALPGADPWVNGVAIKLETGHLAVYKDGDPPGWYGTSGCKDYQARTRDLQKEGALRDWLTGVAQRSKA